MPGRIGNEYGSLTSRRTFLRIEPTAACAHSSGPFSLALLASPLEAIGLGRAVRLRSVASGAN